MKQRNLEEARLKRAKFGRKAIMVILVVLLALAITFTLVFAQTNGEGRGRREGLLTAEASPTANLGIRFADLRTPSTNVIGTNNVLTLSTPANTLQSITLPAGFVYRIVVTGGNGGNPRHAGSGLGGRGAQVTGWLHPATNTVIQAAVGGGGSPGVENTTSERMTAAGGAGGLGFFRGGAGGWGGGFIDTNLSRRGSGGAGGGGASVVLTGGATRNNTILVAAGGGGSGGRGSAQGTSPGANADHRHGGTGGNAAALAGSNGWDTLQTSGIHSSQSRAAPGRGGTETAGGTGGWGGISGFAHNNDIEIHGTAGAAGTAAGVGGVGGNGGRGRASSGNMTARTVVGGGGGGGGGGWFGGGGAGGGGGHRQTTAANRAGTGGPGGGAGGSRIGNNLAGASQITLQNLSLTDQAAAHTGMNAANVSTANTVGRHGSIVITAFYVSSISTLSNLEVFDRNPTLPGATRLNFVNPFSETANTVPNTVSGTQPFSLRQVYIRATRRCPLSTITAGTGLVNLTTNAALTTTITDTLTVTIRAANLSTRNYTIVINRHPASTNSALVSVTAQDLISSGQPMITLTEATGNRHQGTVANEVGMVRVTTTAAALSTTAFLVTAGGGSFNATNGTFTLGATPGVNTLRIRVTAENGTTFTDYFLDITRQAGNDQIVARLTNLSIENTTGATNQPLTLTHVHGTGFAEGVLTFEVVVPYSVTEIYFSGTAFGAGTIASGLGTHSLDDPGEFLFLIVVNAAQGGATETFTIIVTRNDPSPDFTLSDLSVAFPLNTDLSPQFDPDMPFAIETFNLSVGFRSSSVQIRAVRNCTEATIEFEFNGVAVEAAANNILTLTGLNHGLNVLVITVTAEDGTEFPITINITRSSDPGATDTSIIGLSATGAGLLRRGSVDGPVGFIPAERDYFATVSSRVETVIVTARLRAGQTVEINGVPGNGKEVILDFGLNEIEVMITSVNGEYSEPYIILIDRQEKSDDNSLLNIFVSHGELSPNFTLGHNSYTVEVSHRVNSIRVTAQLSDRNATIEGTGTFVLEPGVPKIVTIIVTAENGEVGTPYTIIITREDSGTDPVASSASRIALLALISQVEGHVAAYGNSYTGISIRLVNFWTEHGWQILEDLQATQSRVDHAYGVLRQAFEAMQLLGGDIVTDVDKSVLQALVDFALPYISINGDNYTVASEALVWSGITISERVLRSNFAVQEQVDATVLLLQEALDNLEVRDPDCDGDGLNREQLRELIRLVTQALNDPINLLEDGTSVFTDASIETILSYIDVGAMALRNAETDIELDNAYFALLAAWLGMERKDGNVDPHGVDKSQLQEAILQAEAIDGELFTTASFNYLLLRLGSGRIVEGDDLATQEQVDSATFAIQNALNRLILREIRCDQCDELADECICCEWCGGLDCDCCDTSEGPCLCVFCPDCGELEDECICVFCPDCGELEDECVCVFCDDCGELEDECVCVFCDVCDELEADCKCCDTCSTYPCQCVFCDACDELKAECKCGPCGYYPCDCVFCDTCDQLEADCKCCKHCGELTCDCCDDCGNYPCECEDIGFWSWPGAAFFGVFPHNFWPWFFLVILPVILIILIIIIAVVAAKKKKRSRQAQEVDMHLRQLRGKAQVAINEAFTELREAGACVTAYDADPCKEIETEAMGQLKRADAAMINAEKCVSEYLAAKKDYEQSNSTIKKKKKKIKSA